MAGTISHMMTFNVTKCTELIVLSKRNNFSYELNKCIFNYFFS